MAKEKVEKVEKSDRQERWEAYVKAYALSNPVKYAQKNERGEFETIPESFR